MVDNGRVLSEVYATKAVAWLAVFWACDGGGVLLTAVRLVAIAGATTCMYRSWRYA